MHYIRIHRWVVWWVCLGIVGGAVALVNILLRDLTRTQERMILFFGILHWALGGIACYAFEGIQIGDPRAPAKSDEHAPIETPTEWHAPSEFILPGGRKSLLPSKF